MSKSEKIFLTAVTDVTFPIVLWFEHCTAPTFATLVMAFVVNVFCFNERGKANQNGYKETYFFHNLCFFVVNKIVYYLVIRKSGEIVSIINQNFQRDCVQPLRLKH